jgi:hypothetical protein
MVTPTPTAEVSAATESGKLSKYRLRGKRIHITILPLNKRLNRGKPIVIAFIPGKAAVLATTEVRHHIKMGTVKSPSDSALWHGG